MKSKYDNISNVLFSHTYHLQIINSKEILQNTYQELINAHPTGNDGDSYLVNGSLYVWLNNAWKNVGNIKGDTGATGPKGNTGDKGDTGEGDRKSVV